jgi:hypothetical protein
VFFPGVDVDIETLQYYLLNRTIINRITANPETTSYENENCCSEMKWFAEAPFSRC